MTGFPINLDLSEYFGDLRKYSSIFVNLSKSKIVGDVEGHIKSVFGLEENICLVHKKFLIPKSEDIQILQQYDIYKVQKCNFFDAQIHKSKKENSISSCDQKALNLTQSVKTIDLSCRPKQRIKANVCPSPSVSGTLSYSTDGRRCNNTQIVSPKNEIFNNGNDNILKEKSKHKKKKYLQDSESGDDGDILDMSVNNSKRRKHSNCFSTDEASILSDCATDIFHGDTTKEYHKKPKRKKKHLDEMNDASLDLASPCRERLMCSDLINKDQFSKKKYKKNRDDQSNGCSSPYTNQTSIRNYQEPTADFDGNYSHDDECSVRKKSKHSKKNSESKCSNDSQKNQYYSSSPYFASKDLGPNKSSISKTYCDNNKNKSNCDLSSFFGEQSLMISKVHQQSLDISSKSDEDCDENTNDNSCVLSRSDNNIKDNDDQNSFSENMKDESCSDFGLNTHKRKRKRKHNKKKKKEKLLQMLAVGPTLSQLSDQTATVVKSSPRSECSKHVYFTSEDFIEDMDIPTTSAPKLQTDSPHPHDGHNEVPISQAQPSSNPATWKENLLKLAVSSTKPVLFRRNTSVATSSRQATTLGSHDHPTSLANNDKNAETQENPSTEVVQRCNGEVNHDDNNCENSCSAAKNGDTKKRLLDVHNPLATPDILQNINLSNYPIIDKVVPEDLILFKVWKFNEQGEAGLSKPILAKVGESTSLPHRISLHIMEGCDECNHCVQAGGSDDTFTIELQWSDINEPRLFYP